MTLRWVTPALTFATLLVYLRVFFHDFIYYDDPAYVFDNPIVLAGLTVPGVKWAFGFHASNWHPLTWLSHMTDCTLFGAAPGLHHFVNALFHAANAALLFLFLRKMTRALWPSAIVAALFAWHPLHVESVAWIAERKDVLSTFFGLLALLSYTKYAGAELFREKNGSRRTHYILAFVFFALGLLAKPMLVTWPFLFLVLDYWPLNRMANSVRPLQRARILVIEKLPFFALSAASGFITLLAQHSGNAVVSLANRRVSERLLNAIVAYMDYLSQTLFPMHLAVIYPLPSKIPAASILVSIICLAIISIIAWQTRWRKPWLLMGWLWYLGTLVPVIGLVQVGNQAMADRYSYFPVIGLFVAVVFGAADVIARYPKAIVPFRTAATVLLLSCIALTEHQLSYWQDTKTLFAHTIAVTKNNALGDLIYGVALEQEGAVEQAAQEFQTALRLDPSLTVRVEGSMKPLATHAAMLQGKIAEQRDDKAAAITAYREALRVDDASVEAHNNLANLLDDLGESRSALEHYLAAIHIDPTAVTPRENLGSFLLKRGHFDDALREYEEAARLQPRDSFPLFLIGKAWLLHGQSSNALAALHGALQLNPDDAQALTYLARVLATDQNDANRNGTEALALAEKANRLTAEKQPLALDALAMAYAEVGRFSEANATIQQAIELALAAQLPQTKAMQQRQVQYRSGQPWREAFTNALPAVPEPLTERAKVPVH